MSNHRLLDKAIELARLGLCGRGLPVTSSKVRWKSTIGGTFAAALVVAGGATFFGFSYWLITALYARFAA